MEEPSSKEKSSNIQNPTPEFSSEFVTNFRNFEHIGGGGFGEVCKCEKVIDEKRYAVKRIAFNANQTEDSSKTMREVKILAKLNHENVVQYYNAWIENPPEGWLEANRHIWEGSFNQSSESLTNSESTPPQLSPKSQLFIQQEYCDLGNLEDWLLTGGRHDKDVVLNVFHQLCKGIQYVHSQGIIHRDIKPTNIMLCSNNNTYPRAKIGDFGLSKEHVQLEEMPKQEDVRESGESSSTGNTRDSEKYYYVGTSLYMSPEQRKHQRYDAKVDIYALGLVFYVMLEQFETLMETKEALEAVRNLRYPESFDNPSNQEFYIVEQMTLHNPRSRPDANKVLSWMDRHIENLKKFCDNPEVTPVLPTGGKEESVLLYMDYSTLLTETREHSGQVKGYYTGVADLACEIDMNKLVSTIVGERRVIDARLSGSASELHHVFRTLRKTEVGKRVKKLKRTPNSNETCIADAVIQSIMSNKAEKKSTLVISSRDKCLVNIIETAIDCNYKVEVWSYKFSINKAVKRMSEQQPDKIRYHFFEDILNLFTYTGFRWRGTLTLLPYIHLDVNTSIHETLSTRILQDAVQTASVVFRLPLTGIFFDDQIMLFLMHKPNYDMRQNHENNHSHLSRTEIYDFERDIQPKFDELKSKLCFCTGIGIRVWTV